MTLDEISVGMANVQGQSASGKWLPLEITEIRDFYGQPMIWGRMTFPDGTIGRAFPHTLDELRKVPE